MGGASSRFKKPDHKKSSSYFVLERISTTHVRPSVSSDRAEDDVPLNTLSRSSLQEQIEEEEKFVSFSPALMQRTTTALSTLPHLHLSPRNINRIVSAGYFAPAVCELLLEMHQANIVITDTIIDTITNAASSYDAKGIAQALIFLKQNNVFTSFPNKLIEDIAQAHDPIKFAQMLLHLKENNVELEVGSLHLLSEYSNNLEPCVYALEDYQRAGVPFSEKSCNTIIGKGKGAREKAKELIAQKDPTQFTRTAMQERAQKLVQQHVEIKLPPTLPKKTLPSNSLSTRAASPKSSVLSASIPPLPSIWVLERTHTPNESSSCSPPPPAISLSKRT